MNFSAQGFVGFHAQELVSVTSQGLMRLPFQGVAGFFFFSCRALSWPLS